MEDINHIISFPKCPIKIIFKKTVAKYRSLEIKFKLFVLVHVIILCVYLVYMQGYRQANALASLVFLHQGQNKRAGLPGVTGVAISL